MANMLWNFKDLAAFAVVILVTVSQCNADFQECRATWITKKTVATSYLTLERFSNMRCLEKCYSENRQGRCNIAAFNSASMACHLSMDSEQDIVDISDGSSGVYVFGLQGNLDDNVTLFLLYI